jgi:16S rRNA (cytosine(1402)-N(4))-methyltransferase
MKEGHLPVLVDEVMSTLAPAPGSLQIDATVGGGGHTERILEATNPDGRLLGLDADGAAIARVRDRLGARYGDRLVLRQANFRELGSVAPEAGFDRIDGCLFDLGLSSFQLADRDRGFGFRTGGPLDMRFDATRGVPASELLATLDADEGARRIGELGIGCNPGITRYMKNTLFDEKIDGTVHLAIGAGFAKLGSKNESVIHWDMVKDLRPGGQILCDGEVVQENGRWLI